jgi:predicted RNA-binding protein with RPS1 domain
LAIIIVWSVVVFVVVDVTHAFSTSTSTALHPVDRPPCFYRTTNHLQNRWQQRIELADLQIGQQLNVTTIISEKLDGITGPKIWVDCGVGRYKPHNNNKKQCSSSSSNSGYWKIQTAMLRLSNRGSGKKQVSVARKKVARLRQKTYFPVYVSRIRLAQDQFEVVLDPNDALLISPPHQLLSTSSLRPGQEITGTIVRTEPYGAIVSVDGYNRPGLLHIQRVAELYQKFIPPNRQGWETAGLEPNTKVRLQVLSNEKKGRLFLDFTNDVKQSAAKNTIDKVGGGVPPPTANTQTPIDEKELPIITTIAATTTTTSSFSSAPVSWAQERKSLQISQQQKNDEQDENDENDEEYEEEDWDEYDEDRDIEDALGLGTY